jgi:hypothetical protein
VTVDHAGVRTAIGAASSAAVEAAEAAEAAEGGSVGAPPSPSAPSCVATSDGETATAEVEPHPATTSSNG